MADPWANSNSAPRRSNLGTGRSGRPSDQVDVIATTTVPMIRTTRIIALICLLGTATVAPPVLAADGNRLTHLDEPNKPWQFDRGSPKLITPQRVGEDGVEAVVVLAIDDMSGDGGHFRNYWPDAK